MIDIKKNLIAVVSITILASGILVYIYRDLHKSGLNSQVQDEGVVSQGINLSSSGEHDGYKVTVENISPSTPSGISKDLPNLDLPIVNYSHLDQAIFKTNADNITSLSVDLSKDPENQLKWLNLAITRKAIGDYDASIQVLNYVTILWPNDYVAFNNLADLYQFYVSNYPLAEKNWLKVIEINPSYIDAYKNLYTLYLELYKEKKSSALPILLLGIKKNPDNYELMVEVARYYKTIGDKAQASTYYNKAINEALFLKNSKLEEALRLELADLTK